MLFFRGMVKYVRMERLFKELPGITARKNDTVKTPLSLLLSLFSRVVRDAFNLDHLSSRTVKVAIKYSMEPEADSTVYARAYYVYEDAEGNRVVVYDSIYSSTYNG